MVSPLFFFVSFSQLCKRKITYNHKLICFQLQICDLSVLFLPRVIYIKQKLSALLLGGELYISGFGVLQWRKSSLLYSTAWKSSRGNCQKIHATARYLSFEFCFFVASIISPFRHNVIDLSDAGAGLEILQSHHIMHRDLKPDV